MTASELLEVILKAKRFVAEGSPAHEALMALQCSILIDDSPPTEADIAWAHGLAEKGILPAADQEARHE